MVGKGLLGAVGLSPGHDSGVATLRWAHGAFQDPISGILDKPEGPCENIYSHPFPTEFQGRMLVAIVVSVPGFRPEILPLFLNTGFPFPLPLWWMSPRSPFETTTPSWLFVSPSCPCSLAHLRALTKPRRLSPCLSPKTRFTSLFHDKCDQQSSNEFWLIAFTQKWNTHRLQRLFSKGAHMLMELDRGTQNRKAGKGSDGSN